MFYFLNIVKTCSDPGLANILSIIKKALDLIRLIGPILAIVSLAIILVKLMSNPENKKLKNAFKNWAIALVMLFFIPVIVNAVMKMLDDSFSVSACWNVAGNVEIGGESTYNPGNDKKPSNEFIIDPDDYQKGEEKKEDNSNSTTPSTTNRSARAFLSSLERMSNIVASDKAAGHKWTYSNSNTKNTFAGANSSTKSTNCALYVVWGLVDIGAMDSGHRFYKAYRNGNNYISYRGNESRAKLQQTMEYINGGNRKARDLINEGTLVAGDIVLWYNHQHTNVYAGNNKWYDAGRQGGRNGSGPNDNFKFDTLGPVTLDAWMNERVWQIMRVKEG